MSELEKMLNGKIYDPNDQELIKLRAKSHDLCNSFNNTKENSPRRTKILKKLIPTYQNVQLTGPIYFDYGRFTSFGEGCYANFNFTVLDSCPVNIGKNVFFGPNVSLLTPMHPFLPEERKMYFDKQKNYITDREYAKPITIKDNCWICGNVTIIGGVTIGKNCIIGAGSVVTKDIPDDSLAMGNPCRVSRKISKRDSIAYKEELL